MQRSTAKFRESEHNSQESLRIGFVYVAKKQRRLSRTQEPLS
jgi:hypothetical protein